MNIATVSTGLAAIGAQVHLTPRSRRLLRRLGLVLLLTLPCIAMATPPAWAPANGWRKKTGTPYYGHSGRQWDDDYGVRSGSCNRAGIGAVLGGMAGGVMGAEVGKGDTRAVAIVLGTVVGAAIGSEIGRQMDRTDRSCVGQALELADDGQSVSWSNVATGVNYQLTPLQAEHRDDGCRRFRLIAHGAFGLSEGRTVACPSADGVWKLAPEVELSRR